MKNILYIISTFILIGLTSCEELFTTVRELDIPEHEKKLSVNASLSGDSMLIYISHSKEIDDETPYNKIDAKVSLLENGNEILDFNYNNENNPLLVATKKLDEPIKEDAEYTLIVDSKDFGIAKSSAIAPKLAKAESLYFDTITIQGQYDEYNKFTFVLDDENGIDNYYIFEFRIGGENLGGYAYVSVNTNDPQVKLFYIGSDLNLSYYYEGTSFLISDNSFDGLKRKFSFEISKPYIDSQNKNYKILLVVNSVTKSYFNYLISRQQADESEDNPFAEPVSIVDNIENGYGIFNVHSAKKYVIFEK